MLNRRCFLKTAGLLGLSSLLPAALWKTEARAALLDNVNYIRPAIMPQVIHIFLYGGPSELAGNLTNIDLIRANSQSPYPSSLNPANSNSDITPNWFWGNAGGNIMEDLLASGQMSIYRTVNRIKDNNRAHGRSVTQNQVGSIDTEHSGMATTLAAILETFQPFDKPMDELVFPFVSFEGDSLVYKSGNEAVSSVFRPITLDSDFKNPYSREKNWSLDPEDDDSNSQLMDDMAQITSAQGSGAQRYSRINASFQKRAELADFIDATFNEEAVRNSLPLDPDTGVAVAYPDNSFGERLRAAVSLAIGNPDTQFMSLGSQGLGGWDDHSGAMGDYPARMQGLMEALHSAGRHLELAGSDNVVINVFGEFGRNVNLNSSQGWDHGNNQNLFTLGGAGISGRALGKLAGRTQRIGTPFQNRQFTAPTENSYQFEPFAIASTLFKYFGVQNPEVLTGEPAIDESVNVPNELI